VYYIDENILILLIECPKTKKHLRKIFCDFGESFECVDVNGQPIKSSLIFHISNDSEGVVTTIEEHDLEDNSYVKFSDIQGMTELNGQELPIKVVSQYSFSIGDTRHYGKYLNRGITTEVKKPKTINFVGNTLIYLLLAII
jgi:ubiquitin-activating enzyme E1